MAMRGGGKQGASSHSWWKATPSKPIIRKAAKSTKRSRERSSVMIRPKRAISPYIFFSKAHHARISADNPHIPFGDVGRILGSHWQQMTEKDKQPYVKKAEADKKRYAKDLKKVFGR